MARRYSHVQTRTNGRRGGVLQRARHRPQNFENAHGRARRSGGKNSSGKKESRRRGGEVQCGAGISGGATRAAARVFHSKSRFCERREEEELVPTGVNADTTLGENGGCRRCSGKSHDDGHEERYGEAWLVHVVGRSREFGRVTIRAPHETTRRATQRFEQQYYSKH